jgi:hypothetical protein
MTHKRYVLLLQLCFKRLFGCGYCTILSPASLTSQVSTLSHTSTFIAIQQQNDTSVNNASIDSKQRLLRGLAFSSPLKGIAFGEGRGSAFSVGNVAAKSNLGGGASTANGVGVGGGYGGGLGFVETSIGSAYGGGNGGGNATSIRSEYGGTEGASTYVIDGADSSSTFGGQSSGAGRGIGMFGGLFNFTLESEYYNSDPEPSNYGSFGNKTGGGGSGESTTDVETKGYADTMPFLMGYSGATGSVASAAAGYGFGGGSLVSGNKTISAGGAGGGEVLADALGFALAGNGQDVSDAEFNATGDAVADGGAYGYIGEQSAEPQP